MSQRHYSVIYFVRRADGLVKIGYSSNFPNRMKALMQEHGPLDLLGLQYGGPAEEVALHDTYRSQRREGEWFEFTGDLCGYVTELDDQCGKIARTFPFQVRANLVQQIKRRAAASPVTSVALPRLSETDRLLILYAADVAEQVLPLFEHHRPGDARPRSAVVASRRYANGEIGEEECQKAAKAAFEARGECDGHTPESSAAGAAGRAAHEAANVRCGAGFAADMTVDCAMTAIEDHGDWVWPQCHVPTFGEWYGARAFHSRPRDRSAASTTTSSER